MKTINLNLYQFDELDASAQQKAVNQLQSTNVDYNWWDFIYDDAETIGLKIIEFYFDPIPTANGKLVLAFEDVVSAIKKNHGHVFGSIEVRTKNERLRRSA
jgi:hypothetical protein